MRRIHDVQCSVLKDIGEVLENIEEKEILRFIEAVLASRRVYISGAGRSFFAARAFAQRLYQCGIEAYAAGDTNLPPIGRGDILIACSASGETSAALWAVERAKSVGSRVAAVTSSSESALWKAADITVFVFPPLRPECRQPLGSLFEQSALVLFDCVVILIMDKLKLSEEDLRARHGNLQ